jgi:amino acid adenylation domain-containing protein
VYEDQTLSYNELNQRADKLAAYLQSKGVKLEESVGIMLAVSPEMIVSVLAILKTDGAYLPIDPGYPDERKQYMLADSGANVLISTSTLAKEVKKLRNLEAKKNFGVIFIDFFEFTGFSSSHLLNFSTSSSSNLSYIIYTSGSTGRAKGVMVEHRNVVRLVKNTNFIDFKPGNRILQTGALEFDASTFEIWGALLNGLILYMAPKERILDLQILKQLIAANKITIMWITSPLFNQMVLNDVDVFSGLLNLLVGGDVLSPVHINRVRRRFPRLNIINGYGPTENTTFSTTFLIEKEYKESIPIGRPIANSTAYIVDKNGQLQPIGIAGELWVGGDGVSRGYMNNPELTAKKFDHDLLDYQDYQDKKRKVENIRSLEVKKKKKNYNHHSPLTTTPLHHSPIYKTGDLARWLVDGNIEFSGRIDQQVKIRGFRVEPGEIENHLLSHEHIKEAVVQVKKEENGDKYLCAYIVSPRRLLSPDLKEFLSIDLPGYMIPSCFVILEKIPLTPNGKVDRRSLPEPEIVINEGQSQGPRDEVETKITALWAEVLGIEKNILNINSDFFELGGHSLKAALLISKIHKTFDVNIPLTEIFTSPTIKELAAYIKEAVKDKYISIEPTEKKEYHALSSAQKRLYVLYQMDEEGIGYNIPSFLLLEGSPDKDRLDEISRKLIKRHESLRTSFHIIKEEPVQRIHDKVEFEIEGVAPSTYKENSLKKTQKDTKKEDIKSQELRAKNCIKTFIRPFDLSQTPLMRVGLIKIEETKCIFMLDMHHIISDGISMEIFTKDFMESYAGNRLSSLKLQYKDYAAWQNREKESRAQLRQAVYWQNQFSSDEMPIFELPTDFARPQIQSFEGRRTNFEITHEKTRQLKMLALEDGTTLYMVLLSLFNVFLSKITGQKSILIGTVVRGRRHADLEQIIGMFVNTLALINYPGNQKTFYEFLREVNKKTLQAFENQDYPLEYLVEEVFINRDTSRNPLFDVMFVLQDMNIQEIEIPGLRLQPYNYESNIAKFDLMLQVLEKKENLRFIFEYSTKLFKEETIQRFIGYFKTVVDVVLENPLVKLSGIEILPGEEKHRLLFEFNDTTSEYPKNKTLSLLFEDQVRRTPDHTALIGQIPNPKSQIPNLPAKDPYKKESFAEGYLSYKELNKKSNHLAHLLQEKGTQPDTIVGIMVERSVEMIIGILGILKAGGAYLPIDPDYPQERKQYILDDSSAKILVTAPGLPGEFEKLLIVNCRLLMVNEKPSNRRRLNNPPREANSINNYQLTINNLQLEKASLAYIIYTSGTTGKPKGVMIEHRNVVRLMFNDKFQFDFNNNDVWTMFHSYCFDFSVWEMYGALLYGGKLVLIPRATARDSQRYLEVLKEKKVTILNQTPSAFYNLMNLELKKPRKELYIRWIIFGGETLIPVRLKEWKARYPGTKLINMYGITETTVHVTFKEIKNEEIASTASSIGKPIPTLSTYVLDKSLRLLPIGIPGELCVGGKGVGRGYLNQPELTGDKFINNPYIPGERLYRSGDLVKMSARGNMEYLGRIDYQVKIRGFRIELAEIESQLLTHGEIEDVVVTIKENTAGDKHLFAYVASHKDRLTAPGLREYLLKKLPEYMIPSFFIFLEKIPLTPNGKVDRKALPEPEIKAGQGYTAPGNEVEEKLAGIWAETLGIPQNTIGIDSSFFEMGGHSLKAALLLSKIHKEFDVSVSLVEIFSIPTIRELAAYIKKAAKDKYISIKPVEKKEYYTLSSAQKRLYVLHQMDEQGIGYNIPSVWNVEGDIDEIKFEKVFCELIQRHESLRTSFAILGDEPVQKIHDKVEFKIETGTHHSFVRPFDLSRSPLLRVGLLGIDIQTHFLMIDMHHIISDGTSMKVLVKDFMAMYGGKELSPLGIQYKDFSEWQNSKKQKEWIKQQKTYWQNQFENEIPVLNLPTDYSRPVIQHFQGSALHFELDAVHTRELNNYALEQGVTLYMVLLSLYMVFLGKLSSQDDIVVGTPVAGRKHADLEPIIGMFVNTLALRNFPHRQKIFNQFLREIKERTLQAFTHQDYPYEDLVEAVAVNRDPSRNPLFDTMFAMQNIDALQLEGEIPGLKLKQYDYETRIAKFDISLYAVESGKNLNFSMEYNTSLFKKETIRRFIGYLNKITSTVLENRDIRIYEIDILSEEEKNRILLNFNDTGVEYPRDKTIHQLFAEQVEQRPDNIALHGCMIAWMHGEEGAITYKELNEKSNQLAHVLQSKGMDSDTIVGIMVERSIEMIIGILGILKAGGAYLPIDIGYPRERIDYMLKDSGVYILLTALEIAGFSSPQAFNNRLKGTSFNLHLSPSPVTSLAYVIYTSGSTGKPKGVMVEHPSVVNLLWALQKEYPLRNPDAYLMKTSFLFDVSVTELFGWTIGGGRVVVLPEGGEKDPAKIFDIVEKTGVTHINFVPSMFNAFLEALSSLDIEKLSGLKYIFLAGEALLSQLVKKFRLLNIKIILENIYGPTETTVYASKYSLSDWEGSENIPIGKPISNTNLYILDKNNRLQPIGTAGELCIGGSGLSRGYLNKPELTKERFIEKKVKVEEEEEPFGQIINAFGEGEAHKLHELTRMRAISSQKLLRGSPDASRGGFLEKSPPGRRRQKIYKTGDLAQWLPDGNIEFLGRIDYQVKIRGFRIELGEIESQLLKHDEIKEAVVVTKIDEKRDTYLCAYIVSEIELSGAELRKFLSVKLPEYMIPSYFVLLEKIPLAPNGKIDRKALPEPLFKVEENYAAPGDAVEEKLVEIWREVLTPAGHSQIGIDDNFFQLGGQSLKAIVMAAKIHKEFNVRLPLAEIFKTLTIRGLSGGIKELAQDKYAAIEPIEKKEFYKLSSAQKRLYISQQMDLSSTAYNMPGIFILEGKLNRKQLENVFCCLANRHEVFRTCFCLVNDEPVQKIENQVDLEISFKEISTGDAGEEAAKNRIKEFVKPFDLNKAPLLRFQILQLKQQQHFVLFDIHHIISDGISMKILQDELAALYEGKSPEPLRIHYKDYAHWQDILLNAENLKKQEQYWLKKMKEFELTRLPLKEGRLDLHRHFKGERKKLVIHKEIVEKIEAFVNKYQVTRFMVMITIFNILLTREIAQMEITIGIPYANREHYDLKKVIGIFLNVILIRTVLDPEDTFLLALDKTKQTVIEAMQNSSYPYELLNEKMRKINHIKESDLFTIMFNYFHQEEKSKDTLSGNIKIKSLDLLEIFPKNDVTLYIQDTGNEMELNLVYRGNLFEEHRMQRIMDNILYLINMILEDENAKITDIDMMDRVNPNKLDFESEMNELFEQQDLF